MESMKTMDLHFLKNKRICYWLASLIATLVTFSFQYIVDQKSWGSISMYLASCGLFLTVFGIGSFILSRLLQKIEMSEKNAKRLRQVIAFFMLAFVLLWMYITYSYEITKYSYYTENYNRHVLGGSLWFPILFVSAYLLFSFSKNTIFPANISKLLRLMISAGFVFLQGKCLFHPNLFRGGEGTADLLHMDAYTSSIINICNGATYSPHLNANYGRYGFFYLPIVKVLRLFMNQWFAVSLAVAIVGALMFALLYVLLNKLIKNDVVFFIAVIASGMPTFEMIGHQMYEVYYQVLPHRMFLQIIGLASSYYVIKNDTIKNRVIMWLITVLGLIWNLETGIVFLLVWVILDLILKYRLSNWKQMVHVLFMIPLTVLTSYVLMNVMNLLCGGKWLSFGFFGYPYLQNTECSIVEYCSEYLWIVLVYMAIATVLPRISKKDNIYKVFFWLLFGIMVIVVGIFATKYLVFSKDRSSFSIIYNGFAETYKGPFAGGFAIAIFFLGILGFALPSLVKKTISDDILYLFIIAVLGLGCLTYHYEYTIPFSLILILPEALVLFSLIFDKFLLVCKGRKLIESFDPEYVISGLIIIFISCMAIEASFSLPTKWGRESEGVWVVEGSNAFIQDLDNSLPEGTMCYGIGIPLVCAYMDRDAIIYMQECSNQTKKGIDYLSDEIESGLHEYIFTTIDNEPSLADSGYELIESYDYMNRGEFVFGLFTNQK